MYMENVEEEEERKMKNMRKYIEQQKIKAVKLKIKMERILQD